MKYYDFEESYKQFILCKLSMDEQNGQVLAHLIKKYLLPMNGFKFILSLEECRGIALQNFRSHLNFAESITDDLIHCYYSCIEDINTNGSIVLLNERKPIFREFKNVNRQLIFLRSVFKGAGGMVLGL